MIIRTAIEEASLKLKKNNIQSSILDSEILMSKALNKKRDYIILNSEKNLKQKNYNFFKKLICERVKGKPIAYITGTKSFWKHEFEISENVLIPRPDTELIVEQTLQICKNKRKLRILEIGVGSGCVLLSILKEKKGFIGTGIDISSECIKLSKKNFKKLGINNRFYLYKSDVDNFRYGKYDLIVSNPPYIINKKLKYLDRDVVKYEPTQALNGGIDGLSEIRKVIYKSSELIKKKGKLILEIGFDQKKKVINLLNKEGFYINSTYKDLAGNDRCIVSTKI